MFVYNNALRMLSDTVDSPRKFCYGNKTIAKLGTLLLEQCPFPYVYNSTLLIDLHVCDPRNTAIFSKRLREHIGASLLSLCVGNFGELMEQGILAKKNYGSLYNRSI